MTALYAMTILYPLNHHLHMSLSIYSISWIPITHPPHPLSICTQNPPPPCILVYCQPSGNFRNDEFSSPLFLLSSDMLYLAWSSCSNPIYLLWYNPIQYNLLTSILSTHSAILWFYLLCSLHPNPICSLSLPGSSIPNPPFEKNVILRKINYH